MIKAIIGTMKAEKSAQLIEQINFLSQIDVKFKVFYPSCCNKKEGFIFSRKNGVAKGIKVFEISDLYQNIDEDDKYIFIDEFTFICSRSNIDDFLTFLEFCDKKKINVFLYGLSLDYMSNAFDVTERVLPYCDMIDIKQAICECCGEPANRCIRYVDGELDCDPNNSLLLMEAENVVYKSVCKDCYRKLTGLPAIK